MAPPAAEAEQAEAAPPAAAKAGQANAAPPAAEAGLEASIAKVVAELAAASARIAFLEDLMTFKFVVSLYMRCVYTKTEFFRTTSMGEPGISWY